MGYQGLSDSAQLKEREEEVDSRRDDMTILKHGLEWTLPAQLGQLKKKLVAVVNRHEETQLKA